MQDASPSKFDVFVQDEPFVTPKGYDTYDHARREVPDFV